MTWYILEITHIIDLKALICTSIKNKSLLININLVSLVFIVLVILKQQGYLTRKILLNFLRFSKREADIILIIVIYIMLQNFN